MTEIEGRKDHRLEARVQPQSTASPPRNIQSRRPSAMRSRAMSALEASATTVSPLRPAGDWRLAFILAVVAAFALYLLGLYLLSLYRSRASLVPVVALAMAIQLAPLGGPLVLSKDAYAYWDYGRIA